MTDTKLRIGIDVGGTNTDAVLMHGEKVLASFKASTTPDVTSGIIEAIASLRQGHWFELSAVQAVMIGTTHFINALVEGSRLRRTAALRLGLPATSALPPLVDWPADMRTAIAARVYLADGGHEFDGRLISPFDPEQVRRHVSDMLLHGVESLAISSVFSPINDEFELRAAEIVRTEAGDTIDVSLSSRIGRIGLLERENATVINASLRGLAGEVIDGLTAGVRLLGISAPTYVSQNDGTLMHCDYVRDFPVSTFASGPTNSMRGAAFTSGFEDCAVVDVGGTTADVGILVGGFPRESSRDVTVAGIRTNFRMPDVDSVAIGGGSIVDPKSGAVGPRSVGYRLREQALVFGGEILTATDIAVAGGRAEIGDPERVAHLDRSFVAHVLGIVDDRITRAVDRMRTNSSRLPVVAVGGGSILVPDELPGIGTVHRPENFSIANAIGASIAQVGGEVDLVLSVPQGKRKEVLEEIMQRATDRAVSAGATPGSVKIIEVEELPIPYLPGDSTRVRVKAVGELQLEGDNR